MSDYEINGDRTYTAHEVRGIVTSQGEAFRRAFDELAASLEKQYSQELVKAHASFADVNKRWARFNRWTTWGGWAMFWISGFLFRPFFDLVWKHV